MPRLRVNRLISSTVRRRLPCSMRLTVIWLRPDALAPVVAEGMAPIEVVFDDRHLGRQRIAGWVQPPRLRRGDLRDIEFRLYERAR